MVATSEPLFPGHASIEFDQESGFTGTTGSLAIETTSSNFNTRDKLASAAAFLKPMTLNEQVTAIVACFAITLALAAAVIEGSFFAILSALLSIVMGSYAHYQQTQIEKVAALREQSEALEREIVRLKGDNTRLTYDVDELEGRVEDLLDVEDALEIIAQASSVTALQKDADANLEEVCKLEQSVEANVIETLVSSIYCRSDDDDSETDNPISEPLTEEETTKMIQKLHNIMGLSVDESRLRETVMGGNSVESIFDAILNLVNEDIPAMSRIFRVK